MHRNCICFGHRYLTQGLALYRSLMQNDPNTELWALCLTEECYDILTKLALPGLHVVTMTELELEDEALLAAKRNRSLVEYIFTCKASWMLYILKRCSENDLLTYMDSDIYLFDDPSPLYKELGDGSIGIIPHHFPPNLQDQLKWGKYNAGWVTIRNNSDGIECLKWWRERCIEWCYSRFDEQKGFADQVYLNDWPTRFKNVVEINHPGANLALWNIANYTLRNSQNGVTVDGHPLLFYHYHGLAQLTPTIFSLGLPVYKLKPSPLYIEAFYRPYIQALFKEAELLPTLQYYTCKTGMVKPAPTGPGFDRAPGLIGQLKYWMKFLKRLAQGHYIYMKAEKIEPEAYCTDRAHHAFLKARNE